MADEQRIVVRGEADRQAPADLAALTVHVQVDHADQARAFERASDVATAVDAVLDERAGALGPRQASVVVVQPTTRWVDGEQQRTGWRAARSTSLDVVDLTQVSALLAELVGAGATVHGPAWRLRSDHPVLDEVRALAAGNARQRAEAYAAALGVRVGRVDWVAEPGLRRPDVGGAPEVLAMRASAEVGGAELPVAPADLTVRAAVEVGFLIER
jgi:uncharacterized protein YggE